MSDFSPRTDLACEAAIHADAPPPGTEAEEYTVDGITVFRLAVSDEAGARAVGKPCGRYVTLSRDKLWQLSGEPYRRFRDLLALHIRDMAADLCAKPIDADLSVLVAGLGNREITADAIGPLTVQKLAVTRHLRTQTPALFAAIGCCSLSAVAPGVLGQTGIETADLLRGAVENTNPDLVLAVDALAARACRRLAAAVQLADSGISPGSGIGNHRSPLCRRTLGVPVLALGVPTVVDSSTLVCDALARAGLEGIPDALRAVLADGRSFLVSPKTCDIIAAQLSALLADAIETAFRPEA